jgi:hypothetical protein
MTLLGLGLRRKQARQQAGSRSALRQAFFVPRDGYLWLRLYIGFPGLSMNVELIMRSWDRPGMGMECKGRLHMNDGRKGASGIPSYLAVVKGRLTAAGATPKSPDLHVPRFAKMILN